MQVPENILLYSAGLGVDATGLVGIMPDQL